MRMSVVDNVALLAEIKKLGFSLLQNERALRICDVLRVTGTNTAKSRYGGIPLVPSDFSWPSDTRGPLQLLVQIFTSELAHAPTYFPKGSSILVFHGEDGAQLRILSERDCTTEATPPEMNRFARQYQEPANFLRGYPAVPVRFHQQLVVGDDVLLGEEDEERMAKLWDLCNPTLQRNGDAVEIPGILGWNFDIRGSSSNDPRIDAVLTAHGWAEKKWYLDRDDADILKESPRLKTMLGTKAWWAAQRPTLMAEIESWVPVCVVGSSFKNHMMWDDFGNLTIMARIGEDGLIDPGQVHDIVESA